jgi:hypothetical protein
LRQTLHQAETRAAAEHEQWRRTLERVEQRAWKSEADHQAVLKNACQVADAAWDQLTARCQRAEAQVRVLESTKSAEQQRLRVACETADSAWSELNQRYLTAERDLIGERNQRESLQRRVSAMQDALEQCEEELSTQREELTAALDQIRSLNSQLIAKPAPPPAPVALPVVQPPEPVIQTITQTVTITDLDIVDQALALHTQCQQPLISLRAVFQAWRSRSKFIQEMVISKRRLVDHSRAHKALSLWRSFISSRRSFQSSHQTCAFIVRHRRQSTLRQSFLRWLLLTQQRSNVLQVSSDLKIHQTKSLQRIFKQRLYSQFACMIR